MLQNKKHSINLDEKDQTTGILIHKDLIESCPEVQQLDKLLWNELMGMIQGKAATSTYITNNVRESGLEIWRFMHINNEPHAFTSTEHYYKTRDQLCATRCNNIADLKNRLELLDNAYYNYALASGREFDGESRKHDYLRILPHGVYTQLATNYPLQVWNYEELRRNIVEVIRIEVQYNLSEGKTKSGLHQRTENEESEPRGKGNVTDVTSTDEYWGWDYETE